MLLRNGAAYHPADALRAAAAAGLALAAAAAVRAVSLRSSRRREKSCLRPARSISRTSRPVIRSSGNSRYGFEYSDCWVDDARLVVLNALDAAERGAVIRTRTNVPAPSARDDWRLMLNDQGQREVVTARALVNAAGPWVGRRRGNRHAADGRRGVRLVKGSHIVVRKLFDHDYRLYFPERRIAASCSPFPMSDDFTLIGTTDENFAAIRGRLAVAGRDQLSVRRRSRYFRSVDHS